MAFDYQKFIIYWLSAMNRSMAFRVFHPFRWSGVGFTLRVLRLCVALICGIRLCKALPV